MEDEIEIFSRVISREEFNDNYLISLTSEADTQLSAVSVVDITIKSMLSTGTPIISMSFIDGHGDLVNINRLDTENDYFLYFGTSLENSSRLPLKISRIDFENTDSGRSDTYSFTVYFVMSNWKDFMYRVHNRGWSNIKYSSIVRQIAAESGFGGVDVSDTAKTKSFVTQPHWTNLTLLNNIRHSAVPAQGNGHYEYGVTLDNEFFFLSTEQLVARSRSRFSSADGGVPFLRLEGNPTDQSERKKVEDENAGIPVSFVKFSSSERFMNGIMQGAGGVEAQYYDFMNRRFVRERKVFSQSPEKTLSEWSMVHQSDELSSLKIYGGRSSEYADSATNRVSDVMMSMNAIQISSSGSINYEIGGVIELLIPSPPDKNTTIFNELYSGLYWIVGLEHRFNLRRQGTFNTLLTISRNGMDGKDLSGYVPSAGGRINV